MNHAPSASTRHAIVRLSTVAPCAVMLMILSPSALAVPWSKTPGGAFNTQSFDAADEWVKQVMCDQRSITGSFTLSTAGYRASGTCVQLEAPRAADEPRTNTSEFPRLNESRELFRANWTAQGSYNTQTKEAWERLTVPAGQSTQPGRPYGTYESRMICATDPWLTGSDITCTGKTVSATGRFGDFERLFRNLNRPLTVPSSFDSKGQLKSLNDAHNRYVSTRTITSTAESASTGSSVAVMFTPNIVEPKPGSTHRPQTPMTIRVAAAQNAKDTGYQLEIQAQSNGNWRVVTNIPVTASEVQGLSGYGGWGGHADGTGPQMTASVGTYRVRAMATMPHRSAPGEWVEFKVDGTPGPAIHSKARSRVEKASGANDAMKAANPTGAVQSQRTPAFGATEPAGSALLVKPASPALPVQSTMSKATRPAPGTRGAESLNPQPLPPAAPLTPVQQVPSALR